MVNTKTENKMKFRLIISFLVSFLDLGSTRKAVYIFINKLFFTETLDCYSRKESSRMKRSIYLSLIKSISLKTKHATIPMI